MAPKPQQLPNNQEQMEYQIRKPATDMIGNEVVISGMSGIFPKSNNVEEFMNNLYNKVDMVTNHEEFWSLNHPEMPKYSGRAPGFDCFDKQFFKVPIGQARVMDAMSKKLLENSYGALFDAGVNPACLAGTNVGVFVGSSSTDLCNNMFRDIDRSKYWITGCSRTMQANRISYWLDSKAESYSMDNACGASMIALQEAFWSIKTGRCDSAIVAGANQLMIQHLTLNLSRKGLLCLDGKTKCFDINGDGYARSEAVSVLFLQRASVAKRIYAEIVHVKYTYSINPDIDFLPIRKTDDIEQFLRQFYSEVNISPDDVEYVEACGVGIATGDANELEAISRIFADRRSVKVGSVKSNMGHSEGAADVCSITKVCLAYHKGEFAGNLHYNKSQEVPGVEKGRVDVVTENTPFKMGYTAINSFSYTGMNQHALMKGHFKEKNLENYYSPIPRLVLVSGRLDKSTSKIFDALKNAPVDAEQISILHDFFAHNLSGHTCRGYIILDTNENKETISLAEKSDHYSGVNSPIWFLYSGMGSQWPGMGAELMKIPSFAASIERCHKILKPKGIDIVKIITDKDESTFDNILHSFVGITAIQIGLTDLLREMGIVPDNIIGHSLGEHGCAYADGCFTLEEVVLLSYYRGLVSVETKFITGLMAAVGLGYEQLSLLCPPEIEVACHNSSDSSTISGPIDIVRQFIKDLKSKGIFVKEVQSSNIAYHSKYIAEAGPRLYSELAGVIKSPKLRSTKWVCTSAPEERWNHEDVKYASAQYFVNNLLSNVYFHEAAKNIPGDATIIEISPHGLMQAILRRSHKTNINISLANRTSPNPINFLLETIGKLYLTGVNPKIDILYPKIKYPVSTKTPLLSQLVDWVQDHDTVSALCENPQAKHGSSRNFAMNLDDDNWQYIQGHVRNGAIIFPEAALLVLVWDTLAMHMGLDYRSMSVVYQSVRFEKQLYLKKNESLMLNIMLQTASSKFEICQKGVEIASGFIKPIKCPSITQKRNINDDIIFTAEDIYMLLGIRGYSYKDAFQSIISANTKCNEGCVKWTNEWVAFLDSLIQFDILSKYCDGVSIPKFITKLTINTEDHHHSLKLSADDVICLDVINDISNATITCGGVNMKDIHYYNKPIKGKTSHIENLSFIPYQHTGTINQHKALKTIMQIVIDNLTEKHLRVTEFINDSTTDILSYAIKDIHDSASEMEINCVNIETDQIKYHIKRNEGDKVGHMFILNNITMDDKAMLDYFEVLKNNCDIFVLSVVADDFTKNVHDFTAFKTIASLKTGMDKEMILKKYVSCSNVSYVTVGENYDLSWMLDVKSQLANGDKVVLISGNHNFGLISFVRLLKKDGFNNVRLVMVPEKTLTKISTESIFYKKQIEKDLVFNIYTNGHWGNYYYMPVDELNVTNQNIALVNVPSDSTNAWSWIENPIHTHTNNLVQVSYGGLSLYDYQNTVNKTNATKAFGMDFSGYNCRRDRVMGIVSSGGIGSTVEVDPYLVWPVPEYWNLQEAATVPLCYARAYYCLAIRGNLEKKENVLVMGGAGGLGQAVINLCLALDCTVFTTVSCYEKKRFLMSMFPKLKEEYILCASDVSSLHPFIAYNTRKQLCNYVISCASGKMREEAMKCVGSFGAYMNINDYDETRNMEFGMSYCFGGRSYKSIKINNIFRTENLRERKLIQQMVCEGISQGIVKPISSIVYSPDNVSTAFRTLICSKRIGKVLIKMDDSNNGQQLTVIPRVSFLPKASYLIVGCESLMGIELANWLTKRGARNIIFHQNNDVLHSYTNARRQFWEKYGVCSMKSTRVLQNYEECDSLLNECEEMGPLHGIFIYHEANNSIDEKNFTDELYSRLAVISNLDKVSRNKCHQLRDFVVISESKYIGRDNMVTSEIANICKARNDVLLPSLMINTFSNEKTLTNSDETLTDKLSKLLNTLENSIRHRYNHVISRYSKKNKNVDFLSAITKIFEGFCNNDTINEHKKLKDYNINEHCVEEIRNHINSNFKIDYTKEELQEFTFTSFKNMCENKIELKKGFRSFYDYIEPDEIQASEPIVIMPSKVRACKNMAAYEMDSKETHLIMIPGFEGHPRIFSSIGEMLKIQAVTLQLSPDLGGNSIKDMAQILFKEIKKSFEFQSKFYILGYSFGVNIALELAALLEEEGREGVIYCLDSSPDSVRVHLEAYLGELTETELQNVILQEIFQLMTGQAGEILNEELDKYNCWSKKVDIVLKKLKLLVTYSHDYQRAILEAIYKRIKLSKEYEPNLKLESELVLLRGIQHPTSKKLTDDYNLSNYSKKPVKVFPIECDHHSAPSYSGVPSIINRMLESKLIEEYNAMNLFECYLKNGYSKQ